MLKIKKKKIITLNQIWFAKKINFWSKFSISYYVYSFVSSTHWGFIKKTANSLINDLQISEEQILMQCKATVRNEIRRINTNDFAYNFQFNDQAFVTFYNSFATLKSIPTIASNYFKNIASNNYAITACVATDTNKVFAVHSYIVDDDEKIVRLLHSATQRLEENTTKEERNLISSLNKSLHYEDMKFFKSKGYLTYDWGGMATGEHISDSAKGINSFKKAFGGKEIAYTNHSSLLYYFIQKLIG